MPTWRIFCPFCAGGEMRATQSTSRPGSLGGVFEVKRDCKECGASAAEIATRLAAKGLPPDSEQIDR